MLRILALGLLAIGLAAQDAEDEKQLIPREAPEPGEVVLPRGTRVPLALINSVSSKNAAPGDKIYLQSVYPVAVGGRIMVPPGTYVTGVITETKRPGRVKGKGQLFLRFEQMILPNGTIRDFTGSLGSLDGTSEESLDRETGEVKSAGGQGDDARVVAQTASVGSTVGVIAGSAGGRPLRGLGLGAATGAAAGLAGVLLTRGPDAVLERGTQLEMVLDRDLFFSEEEMTFDDPLRGTGAPPVRSAPAAQQQRGGGGILGIPPFFTGS